jgi:hypothetical protein
MWDYYQALIDHEARLEEYGRPLTNTEALELFEATRGVFEPDDPPVYWEAADPEEEHPHD